MKEAEYDSSIDFPSASFTRSDEGYFGCGYAASFHRVGNAVTTISSTVWKHSIELIAVTPY